MLEETATARKLGHHSLFEIASGLRQSFTENGLHLNDDGYRRISGYLVGRPPLPADTSALHAKIVEKNQLFFHRWRPQNETYLFGFRKHEQGKNGAEIPQFDPLVVKAEAEIAVVVKTLPAK